MCPPILSRALSFLSLFRPFRRVYQHAESIGLKGTEIYKPTDKGGGSSFESSYSSRVVLLKFHNAGRAASSPPSVLACHRPELPLHQQLLLAAIKKLSRDLITPLWADFCIRPATHARPGAKRAKFQ